MNQQVLETLKLIFVGSLRGGGGVHPDFFVELDFEIAVVQQTRARDRNFERVPDSGCLPVHAGQPRPYFVNFFKSLLHA